MAWFQMENGVWLCPESLQKVSYILKEEIVSENLTSESI
jgi:hypothetical protein